jgi:hypothetical protein
MKLIFFSSLLFFTTVIQAQSNKMMTKIGKITFEASVPTFEQIKAINSTVSCVLNLESGELSSLAIVKEFRFKLAMMEEHFNKNYIESDAYPKATFKGKIEDFDSKYVTASPKEYSLKGRLELHGITKEINTLAKIKKTQAGIEISAIFTVNADDFEITIPAMVKGKVSNKVIIKSEFVVK